MHPLLPADPRRRLLALEREKAKRAARSHLLPFTLWTMPSYEVNWHHRVMASKLTQLVFGDVKRLILTVGPRRGKALAIDTPIATPSGWSTMGALSVGDQVFGADGAPCFVVAKSKVFAGREVYAVETDDGDRVLADADHIWRATLRKRGSGLFSTRQLADGEEATGRRAKVVPQKSLILPPVDLPIDPYVLGVWLGDGCSHHATITEGAQDIEFIRAEIGRCGYVTTDRATKDTFGVLGLSAQLRAAGLLDNKHIPPAYLRGSIGQRTALLQGLVDTDGYVDPDSRKIEICTIDKGMADSIQELVWSLGRKVHQYSGAATIDGRYICEKYRVCFYMAGAARLPRRASLCRDATARTERFVGVTAAGHADTVCIQVSAPGGMFLAGRSMLPTHNSELASRRLPAFAFGLFPDWEIIATSYGSDLATEMSRDTKRIVLSDEYRELFPGTTLNPRHAVTDDRQSAVNTSDRWDIIGRRGKYTGKGIGGGITGKGFNLGIIDDPFKDDEQARSPLYRDKVWRWYKKVFWTRRAPEARIVVMHTRWHEDDLVGRLLHEAATRKTADQWTVVNLRELREADVNPDDLRAEGEVLWPARYSLAEAIELRGADPTTFAALYQQRPAPEEGNILKLAWMQQRYLQLPACDGEWRIYGDLRNSGKGIKTSFAVFQVWFKPYQWPARRYLVDQIRGRWDQVEEEQQLIQLVRNYPQVTSTNLENKADAPGVQAHLRDVIPGLLLLDVKGSKEDRARAAVPAFAASNVYLPDRSICRLDDGRPWIDAYVEEHTTFPGAANDDQVDTTTLALRGMADEVKQEPTNLWWM